MKPLLAITVLALAGYAIPQTRPEISPRAKEFVGNEWLNAKPIALSGRQGKPTLVAFWTFGCSNCQANLPAYNRLYAKYKSKGVELIAIHTPETPSERKRANVIQHIARFGIEYPVLIDNESNNWNRWNVQFWPTLFLVDTNGKIRYRWEGELAYGGANGEAKVAAMVDGLLREGNKEKALFPTP
jgi:thiol-disulfide isomerase/thioredoxin